MAQTLVRGLPSPRPVLGTVPALRELESRRDQGVRCYKRCWELRSRKALRRNWYFLSSEG